MSKYTTELRYIVENEKLFPPLESDLALTNILNNYPLENENFLDDTRKDGKNRREVLNEKIISHFYFREIGFETVPRFLFCLQRKMNEIMTIYNQRFKSIDLDINPVDNVNMTETFEHVVDGIGKTTSVGDNLKTGTNVNAVTNVKDSTNENLEVESETPPNGITESEIKSNQYASKTRFTKDSNTDNDNVTNTETLDNNLHSNAIVDSTDKRTETYTRREFGSSKGYTFAQNIEQWRNIMINIETEIIQDLNDLFMNVW